MVEEQAKTGIVLHYTAGPTAASAVNWWNATPERVATAFVVERDGSIYQTFHPKYWAWHLGGQVAKAQHQRTIGIEFVNWGHLRLNKKDKGLYAWPEKFGRVKVCDLADTGQYFNLGFRGERFFQRYMDAQVDAGVSLIAHLCQEFSIPRAISMARDVHGIGFHRFKGVMAHHNFRADKLDCGPAWPWQKLIDAGFSETGV